MKQAFGRTSLKGTKKKKNNEEDGEAVHHNNQYLRSFSDEAHAGLVVFLPGPDGAGEIGHALARLVLRVSSLFRLRRARRRDFEEFLVPPVGRSSFNRRLFAGESCPLQQRQSKLS